MDTAERMYLINQRMNTQNAQGTMQDTYAGRLDAWHTLGAVAGKFQTWEEINQAAKADFFVFKGQLQDALGRKVPAWATFRWDYADAKRHKELKDQAELTEEEQAELYALKLKAQFLGSVGEGYQVIQHTTGLKLMDSIVGEIDGAHYETMGTLDFGRVVWGQVNPNFAIRVGEDITDVYLTFHTSHDGTKAFEIFETGVREICRNTYRLGYLKRLAAMFRLKHTKNAQAKLDALKPALLEMKDTDMSMQERLNFLASKRVTKESLKAIMDRLFPLSKDEDTGEMKTSTRRDNVLAQVLSLYESNDSNAFPEQRGTAYNLLNSITEYADHFRESRGNGLGRAESSQFGSGAKLKADAMDLITQSAEVMPGLLRGQPGVGADVVGELLLAPKQA